jgi:hypothetical protein
MALSHHRHLAPDGFSALHVASFIIGLRLVLELVPAFHEPISATRRMGAHFALERHSPSRALGSAVRRLCGERRIALVGGLGVA